MGKVDEICLKHNDLERREKVGAGELKNSQIPTPVASLSHCFTQGSAPSHFLYTPTGETYVDTAVSPLEGALHGVPAALLPRRPGLRGHARLARGLPARAAAGEQAARLAAGMAAALSLGRFGRRVFRQERGLLLSFLRAGRTLVASAALRRKRTFQRLLYLHSDRRRLI